MEVTRYLTFSVAQNGGISRYLTSTEVRRGLISGPGDSAAVMHTLPRKQEGGLGEAWERGGTEKKGCGGRSTMHRCRVSATICATSTAHSNLVQ